MKFYLTFFVLLILNNNPAFAEQNLFNCSTPISIFNPSFQQGDEIYIKVFVDHQQRVKALYSSGVNNNVAILDYASTKYFQPNLESSTIYAQWEDGSYLTAVYFGSMWGMVLRIQKDISVDGLNIKGGTDIDLHCQEGNYFNGI